MTDIETRTATEVRMNGRKLTGYAAVFGQETRVLDFSETIQRGAFSKSLASGADILALANHDPKQVLARTKSGTLRLSEDNHGLAFEIDVPDTSTGRDLLALAARSDLGGMSFGFTVDKDGESWNGETRTLKSVTLHEVSVVSSFPAYSGTSVQARARQQRSAAARRIALLEMEAGNVAV
ncbi:HK97 family phage prohead protease [Bradyrhizobium ottawaense]|uniref:HK97 family phage prohead protease n=1 Tax=Bradyrhizobium ottawaense TaxID=931866 RepID=UPI0030F37B72